MNNNTKAFRFDDLINDFFADLETGDATQVLENYIRDFPEFEDELIEAAAYQRTVAELPEREYSREEEESLNLRTNSIVQNLLYKYRLNDSANRAEVERRGEISPISNLVEEIQRKGFTVETFARAVRLPEDVIEAFNTREVRFGSIVRRAIKNVASALGLTESDIDNYLLLVANPQLTHLKADESPQFASQMEFLEIIRYDPDFSDEDKQYWLSQKPQEEE